MGASGTSASTLNETSVLTVQGDTLIISPAPTPAPAPNSTSSTTSTGAEGMQISSDIQQLLFSMSPLKIKLKSNTRISTQEQLERMAKFEALGADFIVRYEPNPADKEACANSKKRLYFPKATLAKRADECRVFYAQLMSACGVDSRKYGFFMSMRRDDLRSTLVLDNGPAMKECQFTAAHLQTSILLTLKFKAKKASGKVTVDEFESRVATFEKTFKDVFVRAAGVPHTNGLARHYLIRPELSVPYELHRDLFSTCMKHSRLFKSPLFRLQGVNGDSLGTKKSEGGSSNPLASLGGGGSLGLLSALLSG